MIAESKAGWLTSHRHASRNGWCVPAPSVLTSSPNGEGGALDLERGDEALGESLASSPNGEGGGRMETTAAEATQGCELGEPTWEEARRKEVPGLLWIPSGEVSSG